MFQARGDGVAYVLNLLCYEQPVIPEEEDERASKQKERLEGSAGLDLGFR